MTDPQDQLSAWAASGAMSLTGRADARPLGPPDGMVPKLRAAGRQLAARSAQLGDAVDIDPLALLGERAAIAGLARQGATSCGGASRLLRSGDEWLAVTLARPDDVELLPAWLELDGPTDDPWSAVAEAFAHRPHAPLIDRALLLGLPVGVLPVGPASASDRSEWCDPVRRVRVDDTSAPPESLADVVVVDLTSLWAGPLCGSLLAAAGARVIKVESTARPDGARQGPAAFFDLLNHGKQAVAVDFGTRDGAALLRELVANADVVIEASRPRALEQLGIDAEAMLLSEQPRVWASITGHGRTGADRDRVAFGDDAAVAGGLVSWDGVDPCFCADAVADPTAGLAAAVAILDALVAGGSWLLDISMARVAAHLAGPTLPVTAVTAAAPTARVATDRAPALGEHTAAVLADLGIRR